MQEEKFSTRLNRVLTLKNMKPVELSEKTGIPKSGISQYLSDRCVPKDKNITKIAEVLNISTDYLLGRTNLENPKEYLEDRLSKYNLIEQEYDEIIGSLINNCQFDLPTSTDTTPTLKQKIHSDLFGVYVNYQKSSPTYQEEDFDAEKARREQEPLNNLFIELLESLDKNKIITKINPNEINVAFDSGFDGLNETNKQIIMSQIEFLMAKQKENDTNDKKWHTLMLKITEQR